MRHLYTTAALLCAVANYADAKPAVSLVKAESLTSKRAERVLFATDDYALTRPAGVSDKAFEDLYWVNLHDLKTDATDLSHFGEVSMLKAGKFAVMRMSETMAEELSHELHSSGLACGGMFRLNGDTAAVGPVADPTPVIAVSEKLASLTDVLAQVDADNIQATVEDLSSIFTRHHASETGKGVAERLASRYSEYAGDRKDVTISTYDHGSKTNQPSLVVRIEGATHPDQVVVLGSHIDSISYWGGRSPGADDNASGTATNLEIFRVIMEQGYQFDRTIEIHGYAAEEIGLVGSQDIAGDYKNDGKNVVAMVQHDMNIYRNGDEDMIWFVSNSTNAKLNKDLQALTDAYVGVPWKTAALHGGSSDHASWNRLGVPAAFPFENPQSYNQNIHTADDTIENSGAFTQAAAFAKLGVTYLAHYAGVAQQ